MSAAGAAPARAGKLSGLVRRHAEAGRQLEEARRLLEEAVDDTDLLEWIAQIALEVMAEHGVEHCHPPEDWAWMPDERESAPPCRRARVWVENALEEHWGPAHEWEARRWWRRCQAAIAGRLEEAGIPSGAIAVRLVPRYERWGRDSRVMDRLESRSTEEIQAALDAIKEGEREAQAMAGREG